MDDSLRNIPYNRPYMSGKELANIQDAHLRNMLAGDGFFSKKCHEWLQDQTNCIKALLTHSCTAALEMSALLLDIQPGDEIIMPSYTFVSTANAFVLRGAKPVFVDIRPDTLNIDESKIEEAITSRTKAIVPVHYAGVACDMDAIMRLARRYSLAVVEDAAQGIMSTYKGKALGAIGDLGAYSFHETKNILSGEGGALLVNRNDLIAQAEVVREKGTDRSKFFRGEIDKYTWQSVGSSFLPGELTAAFLYGQFECAQEIISKRLIIWNEYHKGLETFEKEGFFRRPFIPSECQHNAHIYYILLSEGINRNHVLGLMKHDGVNALFHYVPLHSSPGGMRYGRVSGKLNNTERLSERLIRLPLWIGLTEAQQCRVLDTLIKAIARSRTPLK